jgi:tryptophan-rich sensory protein
MDTHITRTEKEGRAFRHNQSSSNGNSPDGTPPGTRLPAGSPRAWAMLAGLVGLCLLVGAVSGIITAGNVRTWYPTLARPPGTPPDWVFGPVWTTLYVLMGVAAWRVWRRGDYEALRLWGWQLLVNAFWTPVFFAVHSPGMALVVILGLLLLVALTAYTFARADRLAGLMFVPYLGWVCYATYLNAGFWWLNGG